MSPLSLPELGGDLGAGPALVVASSESSSAAERDFLLLLLDLPDAFVSELFLPLDVESLVWAGSPPSSFVGLNFCRSNAMEIHSNAERRFAPLARDVVDVALVVWGSGALVVVLVLRAVAELRGRELMQRRAWRSC